MSSVYFQNTELHEFKDAFYRLVNLIQAEGYQVNFVPLSDGQWWHTVNLKRLEGGRHPSANPVITPERPCSQDENPELPDFNAYVKDADALVAAMEDIEI